ncbi:MAG: hypothetical protein LBV44_10610, partial [Methylobacillus sp.]|nr:hypothetical protein [Methylobacillus sp.]
DRLKEKRPLDQAEMERWQQELMNIVAAEDFFAEPEQQKAASSSLRAKGEAIQFPPSPPARE